MLRLLIHRSPEDSALESVNGDNAPTNAVEPFITEFAGNPWDAAYGVFENRADSGLEAAENVLLVEPDNLQRFEYAPREPASALESAATAEACSRRDADPDWPKGSFGWHLGETFSQLKRARESLGDPGDNNRILIGILDTGYDPAHISLPLHLRIDLARNFTGSGSPTDATDPASSWPLTNAGHGTATMALLAGSRIRSTDGAFDDFLGGAPFTEVVPIRIADSVIHFRSSSMAAGIRYAADIGCKVISISMGGVPTRAWADAVNYAYERGVSIFAAAGNRLGISPPANLVYPARFRRVVGVCGFTADKTPYFREGLHNNMQGSFGPTSVMNNAMAAFTPNIAWAEMGCSQLVNPDGRGTSSATPQCAAAAALWLQKHRPQPTEEWRRVEAVRRALFSTADRSPAAGKYYFGQGLLRAGDALDVPYDEANLFKTPEDNVSFAWLRFLGGLEAVESQTGKQAMLETEALQVFLQSPRMQQIVDQADPAHDELEPAVQKDLLSAMRDSPAISKTLRSHLDQTIKQM